jgi:hypothetical protein
MRPSPDITTNGIWLSEQVDRLLGFEMLTKAISCNPRPMPPSILADKIGTYKGYPHAVILEAAKKQHG